MIRSKRRPLPDTVEELVDFLAEHYSENEPEIREETDDVLSVLLRAGFTTEDVSEALQKLETQAAKDAHSFLPHRVSETPPIRVLSAQEQEHIRPEAFGMLLQARLNCSIDSITMERIIASCVALGIYVDVGIMQMLITEISFSHQYSANEDRLATRLQSGRIH